MDSDRHVRFMNSNKTERGASIFRKNKSGRLFHLFSYSRVISILPQDLNKICHLLASGIGMRSKRASRSLDDEEGPAETPIILGTVIAVCECFFLGSTAAPMKSWC